MKPQNPSPGRSAATYNSSAHRLTDLHNRGGHVRFETSRLRGGALVRVKVCVSDGLRISQRPRRRMDHVHELRVVTVQAFGLQRNVLEAGASRV